MPFKFIFRTPRSSSLHRQAAIALYRALLTGISALPTTPPQAKLELSNVIRNRFRQNQHTYSRYILRLLFTAGYEAVDVLDSANAGNTTSQQKLLDLLSTASQAAKSEPKTTLPRPLRLELEKKARASRPTHPKLNVLDRPLPLAQLSGRRHVPRLFSANRIPVLRITKPQSPTLSKIIAARLRRRDKRWNAIEELQDNRNIFEFEDEWDGMMQRDFGMEGERETWVGGWKLMNGAIKELIEREQKKNAEWAAKLQAVEDAERVLFVRERRERRAQRKREAKGGGLDKSMKDGGEPG